MNLNKIILILSVSILLNACGENPSSSDKDSAISNAMSEDKSSTESIQESSIEPNESTKIFHQKVPLQPTAEAHIAIEGEGLRVFDNQTGHATPIAFNSAQDYTVSTLTNVIGKPSEQGKNEECGVDFINWSGLITYFLNNKFVGWTINDANAEGFATASGVGIGTSRVELNQSYETEIKRSTIGIEFSAGGLSGLMSSAKPDAKITNIWAGQACIFR